METYFFSISPIASWRPGLPLSDNTEFILIYISWLDRERLWAGPGGWSHSHPRHPGLAILRHQNVMISISWLMLDRERRGAGPGGWAHYKYCGYSSALRSAGITVAINILTTNDHLRSKRNVMTKVKIKFVSISSILDIQLA